MPSVTVSLACCFPLCMQGVKDAGHSVVSIQDNLISEIWKDRPAPPSEPVMALDQKYTGESVNDLFE